jgi:transglutaminase-like putative cysteine protease
MIRTPTTAQLLAIPDGPQGTRATLRLMSALVRQYRKHLAVRQLALAVVQSVRGHKNFGGMVSALCEWVKDSIQYVRDIRDVETIQTPVKTLEFRQGDCDDQATLLASLLESVGFRARFVAIKTEFDGPFVHVYTEVNLGTQWYPLETTEPWQPGQGPPRVAARMVEDI